MKPKDYAVALYRAVRGKDKKEVDAAVERLSAMLKARGSQRLLPQVLAELPAAIAEMEAGNRMTVETAREIDERTLAEIVRAAGGDPDTMEVVSIVRPELIGGTRIKRQGITIDATVKGRLGEIRMALTRRAA